MRRLLNSFASNWRICWVKGRLVWRSRICSVRRRTSRYLSTQRRLSALATAATRWRGRVCEGGNSCSHSISDTAARGCLNRNTTTPQPDRTSTRPISRTPQQSPHSKQAANRARCLTTTTPRFPSTGAFPHAPEGLGTDRLPDYLTQYSTLKSAHIPPSWDVLVFRCTSITAGQESCPRTFVLSPRNAGRRNSERAAVCRWTDCCPPMTR